MMNASASAQSQDEAKPLAKAEQSDAGATPDIVVTALGRRERLQDAPIALTAIDGDTLTKLGATNFTDYYRTVPSLQVTNNPVSPGASRIAIRGIYAAGESTVGVYYGETPVTGPNGNTADAGLQTPNLDLFDVARVEVLRGPQGTLYGSGSVGGTLRVIFEQPKSDKVEGRIDAQGSTTEHGGQGGSVRGMVNVPLVPGTLALRVVGFGERIAGYVDNVRLGQKDVNTGYQYGGRAILAWTPADNFVLSGTAIYQRIHYDDNSTWFQLYGAKSYQTDVPLHVPYDDRMQLYSGTAKWTLPFATLTATSSYYKWNIVRETDATVPVYPSILATTAASPICQRYNNITQPCSPAQLASYKAYALGLLPLSFHVPLSLKAQSDEVRLSGSNSWIDWTVGGFYEKRDDHADSYLASADPATGDLYDPLASAGYRIVDTHFTQFSQFGEVTLRPFPRAAITGGVRHYHYDKTVSGQVFQNGYVIGSFVGPATAVTATNDGWVGKVNLSYKATDNVLGYAQWAQGFRPGGANNLPTIAQSLVAYGPDKLNSYEVGLKTTWAGGHYTLNVAAFRIDWDDIQSSVIVPPAFRILTNAGNARIQGLEVEATARPLRGLSVNGGFSYLPDAKLLSSQSGGLIGAGAQTGLAGDRLPYTAKFNGSVSVEYGWALSDALNAFVRADSTYRGKTANEFRPTYSLYETLPSFADLNVKIGVEKQTWSAYLFVNNLTATVGALAVQSQATAAPYQSQRQLGTLRPRTVGINLSTRF